MTSLIPLFSRSELRTPGRTIALIIATGILMSCSILQAQASREFADLEISHFNNFSPSHDANSIRGLSIGEDLLSTGNFIYTAPGIPKAALNEPATNSPNLYRTSILIMGIVFIFVTFSQGIMPLLKKAGKTPVTVGMVPEA